MVLSWLDCQERSPTPMVDPGLVARDRPPGSNLTLRIASECGDRVLQS
ncbi:hypothetical protein [Phormidium sp. CCY1219]|nr:hypothetical protein [Phormidium sp. CCY1219]MEB3827102.1 hypothetical protein [Phormidium sp. CCY1219]